VAFRGQHSGTLAARVQWEQCERLSVADECRGVVPEVILAESLIEHCSAHRFSAVVQAVERPAAERDRSLDFAAEARRLCREREELDAVHGHSLGSRRADVPHLKRTFEVQAGLRERVHAAGLQAGGHGGDERLLALAGTMPLVRELGRWRTGG
jgi:hypothetical protein